jgi:hypothetical protein
VPLSEEAPLQSTPHPSKYTTSAATEHKMLKKILLLVLFLSCAVVHNDAKQDSPPVAANDSGALSLTSDAKSFWGNMMDVVARPFEALRLPPLKELLATFETIFAKVSAMAVSFANWITDRFKSYTQLANEANVQYKEVDVDVKELVQLNNKIERRCRSPKDEATRSLCIENQMAVHKKLLAARENREQLRKRYETYQPYLSES